MPIKDSSALKFPSHFEPALEQRPLGRYVSIEMPEQAVLILNEMLRMTGDSPEEMIRKSFGLYKIAVEASLEDCKLAIVDAEANEFVQDIAGL